MAASLDYVEYRLGEWAKWAYMGDFGIGYPPKTIIAKMLEDGGIREQGKRGKLTEPEHPSAEEMDAIILELVRDNRVLAQVLMAVYLTRGSMKEKTKIFNTSYKTLRVKLDLAKHWLAGRMREA